MDIVRTTAINMYFLNSSRSFGTRVPYKVLQMCNFGLFEPNRLYNLKGLLRLLSNNTLASCLNLPFPDSSIRKYLDHLSDNYRNHLYDKNNLNSTINMKSIVHILEERTLIKENIEQLQDLVKEDKEMKRLAQTEEATYTKQLENLDQKLLHLILPNLNLGNYNNVILEISAGVGGQEAMLFAATLNNMYLGYATYLGIEYEILDLEKSDRNGIRHTNILLKGDLAFPNFRYEAGVHRVQRVPETESSGRIHTSTASVAVLPEPTDIEINLNQKDLKIETMRASGAGGQHVNKTDSAVRITHIPSGISTSCEEQKSQLKNKELALLKLRTILYQNELNKQMNTISELRKRQMGLGNRNEKIRTYNYNQDRITDHRIQNGTSYNLKSFLLGGADLKKLVDQLQDDMRKQILISIIKEELN